MADSVDSPTNGAAPARANRKTRGTDAVVRRRRWKRFFWSLPLVIPVLAAAGIVVYLLTPIQSGGIARGVSESGIDLSAAALPKARQRLCQSLPSLDRSAVDVHVAGWEFKASPARLGARWDIARTLAEAKSVGREGPLWKRLVVLGKAAWEGCLFQPWISMDKNTLRTYLEPVAQTIAVRPINAGIHIEDAEEDSQVFVTPSRIGVKLDLSGSAQVIQKAIEGSHGSPKMDVTLPISHIPPHISDQLLSQINGKISSYTTIYRPWMVGRTHNLWLASHAINGALIMPGEKFSYNRRVGERRISKGYRAAPIFVNGKVVDDTGGGVCQVATTLYNTALLAGLKITERHPHSMRTTYSIPGRDATVAWDAYDLQFVNTTQSPIVLTTSMGGSQLTFKAWGHVDSSRKIRIHVYDGRGGVSTYRDFLDASGNVIKHQFLSWDPYPKTPVE